MKQNWKTVAFFLVAITMTALLVIHGQKQSTDDDQPDLTQFPTLDYQNLKPGDTSAKRQKKSKKYNSLYVPVITEETSIFLTSDWNMRLPALPVANSAAIIIGEVTDAQAHLSEDKTKIYSEFTIRIDELLKNDYQVPLVRGGLVVADRFGGRVRFPSGKFAVCSTNHQDLPRTGKRYVLFLFHEFVGDEDFTILTGYELRNGQVFLLDKPGLGHPMMAYKGATQTSLLNDVMAVIASPSLTQ